MANVYKVFMLQTELCARKTITTTTTAAARQPSVHRIYKDIQKRIATAVWRICYDHAWI